MKAGPSLEKAAALSLLFHAALILTVIIATSLKKSPHIPLIYTVNIVRPAETAKENIEPAAPQSPEVETARQKPPPKKQEASKKSDKHSTDAALNDKKLRESANAEKAKTLRELAQKREAERQREQRLSELQTRSRLENIKHEAAKRTASYAGKPTDRERSQKLSEYYKKIEADIIEKWVFPDIKGVRSLEAVVNISVRRDGVIIINRFETPSGNALFDRSAIKAIERASPAEPPPFGEEISDIGIRFRPDEH